MAIDPSDGSALEETDYLNSTDICSHAMDTFKRLREEGKGLQSIK